VSGPVLCGLVSLSRHGVLVDDVDHAASVVVLLG
jgi:hypothetical protein